MADERLQTYVRKLVDSLIDEACNVFNQPEFSSNVLFRKCQLPIDCVEELYPIPDTHTAYDLVALIDMLSCKVSGYSIEGQALPDLSTTSRNVRSESNKEFVYRPDGQPAFAPGGCMVKTEPSVHSFDVKMLTSCEIVMTSDLVQDISDHVTNVYRPEYVDIDIGTMLPSVRALHGNVGSNENFKWANNISDSGLPLRNNGNVRTWPFVLDAFQSLAIASMESDTSVFVAAHTSAGKTVVAEYAVALCLHHNTRCVFTSPVKALSNQKFREFCDIFGADNVGIVTGDVQIRSDAPVVVMTTEILRSQLYNGADALRDLEWVVFDEVHYINDPDRGVVWEETLIMLPAQVKLVCLSATVPNVMDFAEWVGSIKKLPMNVVITTKRPVPLEHFLFTGIPVGSGAKAKMKPRLYCIKDKDGTILNDQHLAADRDKGDGKSGPVTDQVTRNLWLSALRCLEREDKLPAIGFMFSKDRIDRLAYQLMECGLDLAKNTNDKMRINIFVKTSINRLKPENRNLDQVKFVSNLLKLGIGIHHGGMLPILKEIVELLFGKGLLKLLLATETFAMGVNVPARSVVFDAVEKHDGSTFRLLTAAEYTQMSGRAGRRGIDTTGTVVMLCKRRILPISDLHMLMVVMPPEFRSQFHLTDQIILQLLRSDGIRVADLLRRSFCEFRSFQQSSEQSRRLNALESEIANYRSSGQHQRLICPSFCAHTLKTYVRLSERYWQLYYSFQASNLVTDKLQKAMIPSRVLLVNVLDGDNLKLSPAILISMMTSSTGHVVSLEVFMPRGIDVMSKLLHNMNGFAVCFPHIAPEIFVSASDDCDIKVIVPGDVAGVVNVTSNVVSAKNVAVIVQDKRKREIERFRDQPPCELWQQLAAEVKTLSNQGSSLCGSAIGRKQTSSDLMDVVVELDEVKRSIEMLLSDHFCDEFQQHLLSSLPCVKAELEFDTLVESMGDGALSWMPEYVRRLGVLRERRFVRSTGDAVLKLKGHIACRLASADDVVLLTELLLSEDFVRMSPTDVVSVLSCFVSDNAKLRRAAENRPEDHGIVSLSDAESTEVSEMVKESLHKLSDVYKSLGECRKKHQVVENNVPNNALVVFMYHWAENVSFDSLLKEGKCPLDEGGVVRAVSRLECLLRDVKSVCALIGDPRLKDVLEAASMSIKREIVFTPSLYTTVAVARSQNCIPNEG